MEDTAHLIRQASHEIGIQKPQIIASPEEPDVLVVRFKNRRGDDALVSVPLYSGFETIHSALKVAWRGKKQKD